MDPRDQSSIHNQRQPPPPQLQPHGVMMPPPPPHPFAFGHHFPNSNVFMMGAGVPNSGPNLIPNPNFAFNPLTAVQQPFDSGLVVTHPHQNHQQQPPQAQQPHQRQSQQQRNGSPAQGVSAAPPAAAATVGTEQAKKKRGRPRKYSPAPDGISLGLSSTNDVVSKTPAGGGGKNEVREGNVEEGSREKRQRGRPPGSGKKQLDAAGGGSGVGFTMHVLVVPAGENIMSKLLELSQEGPRTICILSANGTVHNVTLRQVAGGTLYHEGQFEIVTLSGSFCSLNSDGSQNSTLNLTVSLAGPDGRLVGGGVTRELIAASTIQMVACSFIADKKQSNTSIPITSPLPTPAPHMLNFGGSAPPNNSTQHEAASDESSDDDDDGNGHGQRVNQNPGLYNYGQPWTGGTAGWA